VDNKNVLIYELIFTEMEEFNIDISKYISNIYDYEEFISDIKKILKQSKVKIVNSTVNLDSKTAIWELKVSK
jgi:hypothetical protein